MFHLGTIPNAEPEEKLILFTRSDLVILALLVVKFLFFLLLPLGVGYFARSLRFEISGSIEIIVTLFFFVYYLFTWMFFYHSYLDYDLDVWMVTNERVISIELQGLFHRVVAELELFRVQDVTSETRGILGTLFNYGNVYIQSAGTHQRFVFRHVPRPQETAKLISELAEQDREIHHHGEQELMGQA